MRILFHVGVGNHDRPDRWNGICLIYTHLAKSLEALGHTCALYVHPRAMRNDIFHNHWTSVEVNITQAQCNEFDICFTWNGSSKGDKKMIELFGRSKCVFGELGFFDHYSTCYFDFSGTNSRSMNMIDDLDTFYFDKTKFDSLVAQFEKPQYQEGRYIFVPLQDETDTQITRLSPWNNMNELVQYASDLTACYGNAVKILYKKHPRAPCQITVADPRLVEVTDNVHHYLKGAELVIGCNSTVLFECLLYHNRILATGLGFASRNVSNTERMKYVVHCYNKQIHQTKLADPVYIKETWFYNQLMEKYNGK